MERRTLRGTPGGQVTGLFTFVLQACFAVMALLIVLFGARVYENIEARGEATDGARTAMAYLAGKVRACGGSGVSVRREGGFTVLVLAQTLDGAAYNTYIYGSGDSICEYFGSAERAFRPEFGEPILNAADFVPSIEDGLLTVSMTDTAGQARTLHLYLRGGGA